MKLFMANMDFGDINFLFPLLLLLPLLLFFVKLVRSSSELELAPLPPGPYPWPILGNILEMGRNPHIKLTRLAQLYGPLFSLRIGTQIVVVGASKAAAAEILKTHDRHLSGRYVPHATPAKSAELNKLSLGWILECDDNWKSMRTLCRKELFSAKALESQECAREKIVQAIIQFIGKMEGRDIKIRDVAFASIINMLSNILVSKDLINLERESLEGEMSRILREMFEVGSVPNISDLYPILGRFDLQGMRKKSMELNMRSYQKWEAIIKERRIRKSNDAPNQVDFLDALINYGSVDDQINVMLMEMFAAGTDTSSSTIEWTMAELMKNPRHLKKVQEEIAREVNKDSMVKESHLPHLTYLQACIKETLRLHPPAPLLLPHRALETCQVMNYTIPKNSQILVNVWAIGRDPNNWEKPSVFNPERFVDSNVDFKGNDFEFIPFSAGRRICPGLPMAAKQVTLLIASFLHFFYWSLPSGLDATNLDMTEKFGLTLVKEQPLVLIPRAKN